MSALIPAADENDCIAEFVYQWIYSRSNKANCLNLLNNFWRRW